MIPRRVMSPAKRAAWLELRAIWNDYERRAANAADQYEALPTIHRSTKRALKCPQCRTDVAVHGLCRWCRRNR